MFLQVIGSTTGAVLMVFFALAMSTAVEPSGLTNALTCSADGVLIRVPELPEGSGVAASKRSPGRFWTHNDSGEPVLVALDSKGSVVGRVRVPGAEMNDWEAIAVGPCPVGSCIYVGDIGDNDAERRDIAIYRVPEPTNASGSIERADVFRVRYPDGAHDAETLLVTPKGDILIVTKGDTGPVGLYRLPSDAKPDGTATLQAIGKPHHSGKRPADERVTDGAVSPGGTWVALRTKIAILLYRTEDLMSGSWTEARRVSLTELGEPQGEGITFGDENTIFVVGEGGGKSQPGTFARVTCAS